MDVVFCGVCPLFSDSGSFINSRSAGTVSKSIVLGYLLNIGKSPSPDIDFCLVNFLIETGGGMASIVSN
jgi:hypothetical protein